jgi:lipoprotein Spr
MATKRGVYFLMLPIFISVALLSGTGCSTMRPASKADRDFYREYSKKMNVSFNGTEEKKLIQASAGWLGVPYRYGGQNRSGIDCSALVRNVYKEAYGITLPRTASQIAKQAKRVKKRKLVCGDLVFFTIAEKKVSHMGMYLGDNKFLHASTSKGVDIADLNDRYWVKHFSGAGRVYTPTTGKRAQANQPPAATAEKKKSAVDKAAAKPSKAKSSAESSNSSDIIIVFDEEF